jgi:hypothetical protein
VCCPTWEKVWGQVCCDQQVCWCWLLKICTQDTAIEPHNNMHLISANNAAFSLLGNAIQHCARTQHLAFNATMFRTGRTATTRHLGTPATAEQRAAALRRVEQQAQRRPRAKRPGQLPPSGHSRRNRTGSAASDDEQASSDCEQHSRPLRSSAEDAARRHAAWEEQRPSNISRLQAYVAFDTSHDTAQMQHSYRAAVQQRVDRALANNACTLEPAAPASGSPRVPLEVELMQQQPAQPQQPPLEQEAERQQQQAPPAKAGGDSVVNVQATRDIVCVTFQGLFKVKVPTTSCNICQGLPWEVHALECGFFPSSPTRPEYWIDTSILDLYTSLSSCGVSMGAFAAGLADIQQRHWWADSLEEPGDAVDERCVSSAAAGMQHKFAVYVAEIA